MKRFILASFSLLFALGQAPGQAAEIPAAPADIWPMYRGTASLTGLSKSKLSSSLKQLWAFKAE